MNWDAIGALGEIIGAGAVFISLLYLALQMRQSTAMARTQFHTSTVATFETLLLWRSENPTNARIYAQGLADFRSLPIEERVMLDGVLHNAVLSFKDVFEAYENGFVDTETYRAWEGFVGAHIATNGGQTWWLNAKKGYIEKIRNTVDKAADKTPPFQKFNPVVFEE